MEFTLLQNLEKYSQVLQYTQAVKLMYEEEGINPYFEILHLENLYCVVTKVKL